MIKLKLEKTVPIHLNALGYIFIIIGLGCFIHLELTLIFIGLISLLLGLFLATAKNGIILDQENNKYKKTVFFLGLELGNWKSLSHFTDISILSFNKGITALSRGQRATTFSNKVFEVYMLTENHRERIILKRYKQEDKATVSAQDLAYKLGMEFNIFSPS
jgi:hypothetical protein